MLRSSSILQLEYIQLGEVGSQLACRNGWSVRAERQDAIRRAEEHQQQPPIPPALSPSLSLYLSLSLSH